MATRVTAYLQERGGAVGGSAVGVGVAGGVGVGVAGGVGLGVAGGVGVGVSLADASSPRDPTGIST